MPKEKSVKTGRVYHYLAKVLECDKGDMIEIFNSSLALDRWAFEKISVTRLVLLPKKHDACEHNDFRPISLVHSLAKKNSGRFWQGDSPRSFP